MGQRQGNKMGREELRVSIIDGMEVEIGDAADSSTFTLNVTANQGERLAIIFGFDALPLIADALTEALSKFPSGRLRQ
jgi:hypothetical protein